MHEIATRTAASGGKVDIMDYREPAPLVSKDLENLPALGEVAAGRLAGGVGLSGATRGTFGRRLHSTGLWICAIVLGMKHRPRKMFSRALFHN
jgi:hypothetical protein